MAHDELRLGPKGPNPTGSSSSGILDRPPPLDEGRAAKIHDEDVPPSDEEQLDSDENAEEYAEEGDEQDMESSPRRGGIFNRGLLNGSVSVFVSMLFHMTGLILLAGVEYTIQEEDKVREFVATNVPYEQVEPELVEVQLDQQVKAATEMSISATSFSPGGPGVEGGIGVGFGSGTGVGGGGLPLDGRLLAAEGEAAAIGVGGIESFGPPMARLATQVPQGTLGDSRAIVETYQEAMDRMTQEMVISLEKGPVLTVWAFDQSESMKDDQKEIRGRISRIYEELGLVSSAQGDALMTAVVSYGESYLDHSNLRPTSNLSQIKEWMDDVPVDISGKEAMCQTVGLTVTRYKPFCEKTRRQMMLVLVTDESGDRDTNDKYLEEAVKVVKDANCRIYTLGREAVFGYPFAHIRWLHPDTQHVHWLPIDRGPETAYVEQLQTNGFHRRYDAFPSGFGPYEQCRLSRETGGIFFMLPSLETNLVRGEKRLYELDVMKSYKPDMRERAAIYNEIQSSKLRSTLQKVVYDLNPYNDEAAKIIVMRQSFSPEFAAFKQQAEHEVKKVYIYLPYLARASEAVEDLEKVRAQEADPRWQANYDLIRAQLVAYQARVNEYAACLIETVKKPPVVPLTKMQNKVLVTLQDFEMGYQKELRTEKVVAPYIERANALFDKVIENHPGTPWAARAHEEKTRGYGIRLVPDYHPSYGKPSPNTRIPKF